MNQCVHDVRAFHKQFGFEMPKTPKIPTDKDKILRVSLLAEEFAEVIEAIRENDMPGIAKETADLVYVAVGLAATYGIDLGPVWDAVHASNMSKVGGGATGAGKVKKPANYEPPDIHGIMFDQGWTN